MKLQDEYNKFIDQLNLPFEPRDYQKDAFLKSIEYGRKLLVSPTASGKSLIIYLLARYYNKKTIVIVPTTSLVEQMRKILRSMDTIKKFVKYTRSTCIRFRHYDYDLAISI